MGRWRAGRGRSLLASKGAGLDEAGLTDFPHHAPKNTLGRVPFADLGRTGQAALWRYALGVPLVGGLGIGVWYLLYAFAGDLGAQDAITALQELETVDEWAALNPRTALAAFILRSVIAIGFLPGLFFAVVVLHRRSIESVMTARTEFAWSLMWASFGIMAVLLAFAASALHFLGYGVLSPSFDTGAFLLFLPFILLLGPLEIIALEMVFRGYFVQATGAFSRARLIRIAVPAALFVAFQAVYLSVTTPEPAMLLGLAALAVFLTIKAIDGDGLESAAGLHLAVNWFALMAVGSAVSAHPEFQALFVTDPNVLASSISLLIILIVHSLLMRVVFARRRRKRGQ